MRYLAIAMAACLAIYTPLAMAGAPTFSTKALASAGSISIYPFDIVLGLAILALLIANAFFFEPDPVAANRYVVSLCLAYVGYQLFIVLPAAVLFHDLRPIDVLRAQEARLSLVLVLVVYGVVLRYSRSSLLVTFLDVAAAVLALWVVYVYATKGGQGTMVGGRYTVREIWGGATLLFGWLFYTSLFYWPVRWWRVGLAILAVGGIVLANHRSGFVALIASFVVLMLAMGRVTRRVVLTVAVIGIVGLGVSYMAPSVRESAAYSVRTMFSSTSDTNAQDRVVRSRLGFDYFVAHPMGDYIWSHRYYLVNVNYDFPPHNFVVQLLTIQGLVASLLLFAVMGGSLAIAWKNRRDPPSAVMLAYLTFYLTFSLFNTTIDQLENLALFGVAAGFILHRNRVLHGVGAASAPRETAAVTARSRAA